MAGRARFTPKTGTLGAQRGRPFACGGKKFACGGKKTTKKSCGKKCK